MSHPSGDTSAYLTFRAGCRFALRLEDVHEVLPLVELNQPPAVSAIVAGIINVSGTAVTVVRLASLLGLEEPPVTIHSHLIRLKAADACMALLCQRVEGIQTADVVSLVFLREGATFNGCASARITSEGGPSSHLIELTGSAYYDDKPESLFESIERRMDELQCPGPGEYLALITSARGASEFDRLIDEIAIGETYFFRYPEQFDALRQTTLPERIEARRGLGSLRIWSVGCAIGAEPYSIAILLEHEWPETARTWPVYIEGTDICARRLERARHALYSTRVSSRRSTCTRTSSRRSRSYGTVARIASPSSAAMRRMGRLPATRVR